MTIDLLQVVAARAADAAGLLRLRDAAADDLGARHGPGHWALRGTEAGVRRNMVGATILTARQGDEIVGALRLAFRKPWAIDPSYFTRVRRAIYLTDMAVLPALQGRGVGRLLLEAARAETGRLGGEAIRLDAYDAPAGAGGFYRRCGYADRGRVIYRNVPLLYFETLI